MIVICYLFKWGKGKYVFSKLGFVFYVIGIFREVGGIIWFIL